MENFSDVNAFPPSPGAVEALKNMWQKQGTDAVTSTMLDAMAVVGSSPGWVVRFSPSEEYDYCSEHPLCKGPGELANGFAAVGDYVWKQRKPEDVFLPADPNVLNMVLFGPIRGDVEIFWTGAGWYAEMDFGDHTTHAAGDSIQAALLFLWEKTKEHVFQKVVQTDKEQWH